MRIRMHKNIHNTYTVQKTWLDGRGADGGHMHAPQQQLPAVSIRQHSSALVSIRQRMAGTCMPRTNSCRQSVYVESSGQGRWSWCVNRPELLCQPSSLPLQRAVVSVCMRAYEAWHPCYVPCQDAPYAPHQPTSEPRRNCHAVFEVSPNT
jgi:hypothetical protein